MNADQSKRTPRFMFVCLPPDKGRKQNHLAVVSHYGGGWWKAACMGEAKRCREGTCKHTANLVLANGRRVKQISRDGGIA